MKKIKWDVSKNSDFVENIDSGEIEKLYTMLQNFSPSENFENSEIETLVNITIAIYIMAIISGFFPARGPEGLFF